MTRRSLRRVWIPVVLAVVGAAVAIGFGTLRGQTYQSSTVLMYREVIPAKLLQGPSATGAQRNMALRFRDLVYSSPLLERIIEEQELYPVLVDEEGMAAAVEEMRDRIKYQSRGGGTFHLSYTGDSPERAEEVTAALAEELIAAERRFQREGAETTREFLTGQLESVEETLHEKELALVEFLAENPEFAEDTATGMSGATGASIRARSQKEKDQRKVRDPTLRALQRQRARIRKRLESEPDDEQAERGEGIEVKRADQGLSRARQQLRKEEQDLELLLGQYTDRHPDAVAAQRRVEQARRRVERAEEKLEAVRRADEARRAPVRGEERTDLEEELESVSRAIVEHRRKTPTGERAEPVEDAVVELETRWARLSRALEEARERRESIEAKAFTAEIVASSEAASEGNQLVVLDPASRPTRPAGVSLRILALAGFVAFGGLGGAVAVALALADDRIFDPDDLRRFGLEEPLASIPRFQRRWFRG